MNKYSINVQWSDEDECFVAMVPEFPNLIALGDTQEEALAEAQVALQGFIEIYQEESLPLPEPKYIPTHSGQLRIRIPKDLHAALAKEAERQGVSLNTHIIYLLSEQNITTRIEDRLKSIDSQVCSLLFSNASKSKPASNPVGIMRLLLDPESDQLEYRNQ